MSKMIAVVGVGVLLLAATVGLDAAFVGAGDPNNGTETFEPVGGETVTFAFSNYEDATYADRVDVFNNTLEFEPDGNYTWNDNGTLTVTAGGELAQEQNADINATWTNTTRAQQGVVTTLSSTLEVGGLVLVVLVAGLVMTGVRVLGGL